MFRYAIFLFLPLLLSLSCSSRRAARQQPVEAGVARSLALYRKTVLSGIRYTLDFDIPEDKKTAITAQEQISFTLSKAGAALPLDFKEDPAKIRELRVNGQQVAVDYQKEHVILQGGLLKKGQNMVSIAFQAGDGALNRNADYLYTLFVPDRARTVFPCFDQPDLKAIYSLSLHLPIGWQAIANAAVKDSVISEQRKTYRYKPTELLSTYHFAFAAGKFAVFKGQLENGAADFLYRETDQPKIRLSIPEVYAIHAGALKYYEQWTGIKYPYQKFGFVAIPDFQFGGMEHPGAIQYKASSLFLDGGATKDQLNARNNLIAHETAHMWFGDMVTMNWFTDVWMKEVFANFMADKSAETPGERNFYRLKFLIDHVPAAYAVDRSAGANPIRQPLDNLKDAGTLYGNIIYHKAPVMMQQLESLMGKTAFQQGVREYLRMFAQSNASWPDLIQILDRYTPADLRKWNKVWVNESGRPVVSYRMDYAGEKIAHFSIEQQAEFGAGRVWPQTVEVSLVYQEEIKVLRAALSTAKYELSAAHGLRKPLFVLFNSSGEGYGRWPVDTAMISNLYSLKNPVHRATAYISLYEQMLSGNTISPGALLALFGRGLETETEELNIRLLTGYISTLYWQFSTVAQRKQLAGTLENQIWSALQHHPSGNNKKQLYKAYQDIFMSPSARSRLYTIWKNQQAPAGISLSEDDYTSLAFSLALRDDPDTDILQVQQTRITNPDRKVRFAFIVPALSGNEKVRDQFFASLGQAANRTKESNVLAALFYLHHPLRQASSVRYLQRSLAQLEEIQATGDIFFPQSWLQATFGTYQSKQAADVVHVFLKNHTEYNPRLRAKILQSANNLFRAQELLR